MIATAWQLGGTSPTVASGCASGRTCSVTAATTSPNPAATPSPSASSAPPAPSTAAPNASHTAKPIPGAATSDETVVLVLAEWQYAGTGHHTSGISNSRYRPPRRDYDTWAAPAA